LPVASLQSVDYYNFTNNRGVVATLTQRSRTLVGIIALAAMMLLPACYTLFRHPRLSQLNYRRPDSNRCQTCHATDDLWKYTHPWSKATAARSGSWVEFYDLPWWFDGRWQVSDADTSTHRSGE
jgi:hypothetical protein